MMFFQEIELSSITHMELTKNNQVISNDGSNNVEGTASPAHLQRHPIDRYPHIFEFNVGETIYYVGEDPAGGENPENIAASTECGIGREVALCWETAIRQAFMPVTVQPS